MPFMPPFRPPIPRPPTIVRPAVTIAGRRSPAPTIVKEAMSRPGMRMPLDNIVGRRPPAPTIVMPPDTIVGQRPPARTIVMPPDTIVGQRPPAPTIVVPPATIVGRRPPAATQPAFQPPTLVIPPRSYVRHAAPSPGPHPTTPRPPSAPPNHALPIYRPLHVATAPHYSPPSARHFSLQLPHFFAARDFALHLPHIFAPGPHVSSGSHKASDWYLNWPWHRDQSPRDLAHGGECQPATEGARWREIYEKLRENPNFLSGLPEPRTPFEAHVKSEGYKEGYLPIWDPSIQVSVEDKTLLGIEYVAFLHKAHWLNAADRGVMVETVWCPARCYLLLWRPDFKNQGSPTLDCNWYVFTRGSKRARSWTSSVLWRPSNQQEMRLAL
jgi:hypothetical protein